MRYMLLIYGDESGWGNLSEEDQQAEMTKWYAYTEEMRSAGVSDLGDALQSSATATTVRAPNGEPIVTDGPFAETKEQLLGFYVVDCASIEQALETARELAAASGSPGAFEIRPLKFYAPGSYEA